LLELELIETMEYAMTELYEMANIRIFFDQDTPCLLYTAGKLPHTDSRMRSAYRKLIALCVEYKLKYSRLGLIADATAINQSTHEDLEWSAVNVMPKIVKAGIQKIAFVYKPGTISQHRVREYLEMATLTGLPIHRKDFDSMSDAREWIKTHDNL
jgi:hypothetical protein